MATADEVATVRTYSQVPSTVLDDTELSMIIDNESGDINLSVARTLEVVANNQALVLKVIDTRDLSTDGAKLSKQLMAQAQQWRDLREVELGGDIELVPIEDPFDL